MMCLPALIGCSKDNNNPEVVNPPLPPIEVDRSNMFGMVPALGNSIIGGALVDNATPEIVADLCEILGVKSYRMSMYQHWILEFDSDGNLRLKENEARMYREYMAALREKGVVNIMPISPTFMYPHGHSRTYWVSIPDPATEPEVYIEFLELIEDIYTLLAEAFPDINYFEVGNELNAPNGHNLSKNGFLGNASVEDNAPYIFTSSEIAAISADICYYANRGIKAVNPRGMVVAPSLFYMDNIKEETKEHFEFFYKHITSGKLPSCRIDNNGNRTLPVDVEPDHYFEYLNWHPYLYEKHTLDWLDFWESMYRIALDYGDTDKKVLCTEFGYYDSFLERREESIADACVPAIKALTERIPAIESIYIFRMFNWTTAGADIAAAEKSFGIFDSPLQPNGVRPKPVAISLFYYFNGVNANPDPLFKYMK
jgi:hypothetical protein